ncbi:hypothetical protein [Lyngbya sp. PCC 8106]|uniref:hypothetical protein n=1 Tax=Lyngbya sp. (strain PCC 8106) TaxID=313612 RepID=UPI0000EA9BB4|nr:hypothetical protein [Lyngbya sp. PCC 8106]EAW37352.1 hypothetical protein L8106_12670 [Lyngbya sp. PCC 8106]
MKSLKLLVLVLVLLSVGSALSFAQSTSRQRLQRSTSIAQNQSNNQLSGYCFSLENETLSSVARIYLEKGNQVTGHVNATIHNEEVGYYTSYFQTLQGTKQDQELKLNIITKIELDTQKSQENWQLEDDFLNTGREVYERVPCLVSRIQFARGASSGTVENSVIRGSRDIYLLDAKQGQKMEIDLSSLENNAVFEVMASNGEILNSEETQSSLILPATGRYEIIVGGTRGNATYKLTVKIR